MKKFAEIITSETIEKTINLEQFRVVIGQELNEEQIASVVGAIGYAQAEHIRVRRKEPTKLVNSFIFGDNTVLDISVPFSASPRSYIYDAIQEFLRSAQNHIKIGKLHVTSDTVLGAIGDVKVQFYVETEVEPKIVYRLSVESKFALAEVQNLIEQKGLKVLSIREE